MLAFKFVHWLFCYICSNVSNFNGNNLVKTEIHLLYTKDTAFRYYYLTRYILLQLYHCQQRAPVGIVLSSSGTSQLGMFDIQATTKCKYYDHIVLLYLESRRCRYRSIIFACFYLYVSVVNLIDYLDIDKMMDINNEKC
jgi:hypothetical protein